MSEKELPDTDDVLRERLVTGIASAGDSTGTAGEYAGRSPSSAPLGVRDRAVPLDGGIRLERSGGRRPSGTADVRDGVEAFGDDRRPEWQAR